MRFLRNSMSGVALALCSTKALAGPGGAIVFGANASAIPTIPGTMLVVLGLILAFIAFKVFANKSSGNTAFLVTALSSGAILSMAGGAKLIENADAGTVILPPPILSTFIIPNTNMDINPGVNIYRNNTGTPQKVLSITLPGTCPSPTAGGMEPLCTVGQTIAPLNSCSISCPGGGT